MLTAFTGIFPPPVVRFHIANMNPMGFIFIIFGTIRLIYRTYHPGNSACFTVFASLKKLFRLWLIVYGSNILGGILFALVLCYFARSWHPLNKEVFAAIARPFI